MFCPNCGKDCGSDKFCTMCGTRLAGDAESKKQQNVDVDLNDYYVKYRHNRIEAIVALRVNTGMESVEAKKVIDTYFDSREGVTKHRLELETVDDLKSRLDASGVAYCPKCFSTKLFKHEESAYRPRVYYQTAVFRLIGSVFNLLYTIFGKHVEYVCLDCGHRWK